MERQREHDVDAGVAASCSIRNLTRRARRPTSLDERRREPCPVISEVMTWDEICACYPGEWVCLAELEFSDPHHAELRAARVIGHGKTQDESLDQGITLFPEYDEIGHFYTGELDTSYLRPVVSDDAETRDAFRHPR